MPDALNRPRWGIFGGTFDPPHCGHLVAAEAVRDQLGLDRVILMVAGEPWQKTDSRPDLSPGDLRLEMVRALVEGNDRLVAGDDEVRRPGPTYTVDTLRALRAAHPDVDFFLVLGADAAANIGTWRDPGDVLALSTLVIVTRTGSTPTLSVPPAGARIEVVEMNPVDVSSTSIRAAVAHGRRPVGTTDSVVRVIDRHGLYRGLQ